MDASGLALLTKMSSCPNSVFTLRTIPVISSGRVTSACARTRLTKEGQRQMSSRGGREAHRLSGNIGVTSRSSVSATSTPVLSGEAQVVHFGRTRATCLCRMERAWRRACSCKTVLFDQRVQHQSAVDAPQNGSVGRIFRSRFRDHQAFAFFTGHVPTS